MGEKGEMAAASRPAVMVETYGGGQGTKQLHVEELQGHGDIELHLHQCQPPE